MSDKNPIEDLKEIRKMMESSSKFLSLSGLSGIFAGLTAIAGAWWGRMEIKSFNQKVEFYAFQGRYDESVENLSFRLGGIALLVLIVALLFGVLFTWLKAKKQNKKLLSPLSIRLVISLMVPLSFGGLFVIGLFYNGYPELIAPATLIFYGLSLLNASKYVHVDIKYLALCEMGLGLLSMYFLHKGILFWTIGFGGLHILYGTIMYFKYDRKQH